MFRACFVSARHDECDAKMGALLTSSAATESDPLVLAEYAAETPSCA